MWSYDILVIQCLLQNVTSSPTKNRSICCRRIGLEPTSSMLCAFAFILQGERLCHLSWVHHKAKLIHGYETPLELCTGRHCKRTTKRGCSSSEHFDAFNSFILS